MALKGRVKEELDALIRGVIRNVEEPIEWVNSLVILEKSDGDLRLCIDSKDLNKAIQREHFRLQTKKDITSAMNGGYLFFLIRCIIWILPNSDSREKCKAMYF